MKMAVVFNDTRTQLHHGCELVMSVIENELNSRGIKVIEFSPEGIPWKSNERVMAAVRKADLVVVNGEGTIHHGRPAGRDLLEVGNFATKIGIPAALINCSYQENPPEYRELLGAFSGIWCREARSAHELRMHGASPTVVPDLTLCSGPWEFDADRSGIGVTDSAYTSLSLEMYRYAHHHACTFMPVLRTRRFEGKFRFRESLRHSIHSIRRRFIREPPCSSITESDYLAIRNIYIQPTISSYIRQTARHRLIISGRFHVVCFCLLTGTPFLALPSNSHKIEGIIEDIGLNSKRLVGKEVFSETLNSDDFQFNKDDITLIEDYLNSSKQRASTMFDKIGSMVS